MLKQNFLSHFPGTPRSTQVEFLKEAETAINAGTKFIVGNIPTGGGKSHLSATMAAVTPDPSAKYLELVRNNQMFLRDNTGAYAHAEEVMKMQKFGCIVLTTTKVLQNQYDELFEESTIMKGKRNYRCDVDEDFDTDIAPCVIAPELRVSCIAEHRCPYYNARDEMVSSKFAVLNYSMFFALPEHVKRRAVIICDEATELEEELVKKYSLTIDYGRLAAEGIKFEKLLTEDPNKVVGWLADITDSVNSRIAAYQTLFEKASKKGKERQMVEMGKYKYLQRVHEALTLVTENWFTAEYLIEKDGKEARFTPLYVNNLAQNIFRYADTVLLMSATIIDHKTFTDLLGIKQYKYVECDSTFNPKDSPIHISGKYPLNHKMMQANLPKVIDMAMQLCNHHKDDKGVIHTHTFMITEALQKRVKNDPRFLFREPGVVNEDIIQEHIEREDPTILVSPSMAFGVSLDGDSGRFQIIMKMPFLPLSDKRIKTLFDKNPAYYTMKMLVALIQMCGRTTRSKEDHSVTYILDATAISVLKMNSNKLPKAFKARLQ